MHNPDINSLHDLVKLLVGASAEVDVAIEQRVEEGTTVIAGFIIYVIFGQDVCETFGFGVSLSDREFD